MAFTNVRRHIRRLPSGSRTQVIRHRRTIAGHSMAYGQTSSFDAKRKAKNIILTKEIIGGQTIKGKQKGGERVYIVDGKRSLIIGNVIFPVSQRVPEYVGVYWGTRNVPIDEIRERFKKLEDSRFGYKTNEYKDLERFLNTKSIKKV